MRRSPSKPPSKKSVVHFDKPPDVAMAAASDLGLSRAQLDEVIKAMLGVAWRMGFPKHLHRLEVVSAGFITAISKPISERPSTKNWNRFVAWMCALAQCAAMTIRNSKHQRLLSQGHSDDEMAELLPISGGEDLMVMRELLSKAWPLLQPADRAILEAYYFDDQNTEEMAIEKKLAPSTVSWRYRRALRNMRRIVKSLLGLILLFFSKKAQAQSARLVQIMPRLIPHVTPTAWAMTVIVACGVVVPAGSMATTISQGSAVAVASLPPKTTIAAATAPPELPVSTEVEPEKPIAIDEPQKQWSAADMNSFKIAKYVQLSLVPFAFLVAPAVTQVACAGAEQRLTPPPQEPEERDDTTDPYVVMCENERHRGDECPSKADWCAKMGMRPATKGCQ